MPELEVPVRQLEALRIVVTNVCLEVPLQIVNAPLLAQMLCDEITKDY